MTTNIELLTTVAVREDLPALSLNAGEVGAVVEVLAEGVFEVEFVDETGRSYETHTLRRDQLMPLHHKGRPLRLRAELA